MDEPTVLGRLDAVVRANRFTIAIVFPVVGATTLVASAEGWLPDLLAFNAVLILVGTLIMRSPLLVGAAPLVRGWAIAGLIGLIAYTYAIEYVGVTTGYPYGEFTYAVALGPMLASIPVALPLFFIPLVVNAYLVALLVTPRLTDIRAMRIPLAVGIVLVIDLVLDPAAVAIGFWTFSAGGLYYDVPVSNFLGWVLSGTLGVIAIDLTIDRSAVLKRVERCEFILDDFVSFVLLWGLVNLYFTHLVPVAFTFGLIAVLLATGEYVPSLLAKFPHVGASIDRDRT